MRTVLCEIPPSRISRLVDPSGRLHVFCKLDVAGLIAATSTLTVPVRRQFTSHIRGRRDGPESATATKVTIINRPSETELVAGCQLAGDRCYPGRVHLTQSPKCRIGVEVYADTNLLPSLRIGKVSCSKTEKAVSYRRSHGRSTSDSPSCLKNRLSSSVVSRSSRWSRPKRTTTTSHSGTTIKRLLL